MKNKIQFSNNLKQRTILAGLVIIVLSINMVFILFFVNGEKMNAAINNDVKTISSVDQSNANELEILNFVSNPFDAYFEIEFNVSSKSNVDLTLIDAKGKTIERINLAVNEGENIYRFARNRALKAGTYFVSIVQDNKRVTKKIVRE